MDISSLTSRLSVIASLLLLSTFAKGQKSDSLFVFIGEVISVEPFNPDLPEGTILRDAAFLAKCLVIEPVFGHFEGDTIEFEVYDHMGWPGFAKYKHVLMYTGINKLGKRYHVKYTYQDLYKTIDGKWASPYAQNIYVNFGEFAPEIMDIKPEKINFTPDTWYSIDELPYKKKSARKWFRRPYYKIKGDRIYPLMGHYPEQLFELEKLTTLEAHEFFK